jgi:hypothetical protein
MEQRTNALRMPISLPQDKAYDDMGTPAAFYVAFASCLLSALLITFLVRGSRTTIKPPKSQSVEDDETFRGIQFTTIPSRGFG